MFINFENLKSQPLVLHVNQDPKFSRQSIMREKSSFPVFQVPQVSPVLQVSRLPPAVPARAQWSAHTHASEPARHHVANVAKCLETGRWSAAMLL